MIAHDLIERFLLDLQAEARILFGDRRDVRISTLRLQLDDEPYTGDRLQVRRENLCVCARRDDDPRGEALIVAIELHHAVMDDLASHLAAERLRYHFNRMEQGERETAQRGESIRQFREREELEL